MTSIPTQPQDRNGFRIAIICALPLEAEMVQSIFDKDYWLDDAIDFGQAEGDENVYSTGVIGKHNVVLAYMPGMGGTSAATVATRLRFSYHNIEVAFVVGICGVAPRHPVTGEEIILGDCIISTTLIQYDFGRQYPGFFERKAGFENTLGHANQTIRALTAKLQTAPNLEHLSSKLVSHLQQKLPQIQYPGRDEDLLFEDSYLHVHRDGSGPCTDCIGDTGICKNHCEKLKCEASNVVIRDRLRSTGTAGTSAQPRVHFGRYGSANTVLKSGIDRERLVKNDQIMAFEMEGAGVWDNLPTILVKSACDYADSHKNKNWQRYAAATAAAGLKAILEQWRVVDVVNREAQHCEAAHIRNIDSNHKGSVRLADELVRNYYRSGDRLLIKRLSGQELDLETCYINLALIDRTTQTRENGRKTATSLEARLLLDASKTGQSVPLADLFKQRRLGNDRVVDPRRIFIQGRAGVGKTTLCKKIVYEFLEGRLGSGLFDRLIWVPLRTLKMQQKQYGWPELLQDTFRLIDTRWRVIKEAYEQQFDNAKFLSRTLFLFDGLDEISYDWKDDIPMYGFVNTILHDLPNIIITSRPQAKTFSMDRFDLDFETTGFTLDQISTYIKNCVRDTQTITTMEKAIAQRPLIRGLLRIPIQLDAFCYTWTEDDESNTEFSGTPTTMTALYESIAYAICWKDLRLQKASERLPQPPPSQIEQEMHGELAILGEVAFQGLLSNVVEFLPVHWKKLGNHFYESSTVFTDAFSTKIDRMSFLRTSDHGQDPMKRAYHFIHLTFQEYFAARHFTEYWQHNRSFNCQHLTGRSRSSSKLPIVFLQEEKYNPRYNIFWRFVAGLLADKHDAATFFERLHSQPIDLLGSTHRRLTMHCLSEVVADGDKEPDDLYNRETELLKLGLLKEYRLMDKVTLGTELEFPEKVLRELLHKDSDLPYSETLRIIDQRPTIEVQTAKVVGHGLSANWTRDIQLQAAGVLWKHFAVCEQLLQQRCLATLKAAMQDEDRDVRRSAARAMKSQSILSEAAMNALIAILKDEDEDSAIRHTAASALEQQSSVSGAAMDVLIAALKDEDSSVRSSAAGALNHKSSLSEAAINALIAALKDENRDVRSSAASALGAQSSLSETAMNALIAVVKDKDEDVQMSAGRALLKQSSPSAAAMNALTAALKNEDVEVRRSAAYTLKFQSSLSESVMYALIAALKDENVFVRMSAASALERQSYEAASDVLIAALKDEDAFVRLCATAAPEGQPSEAVTNALIATLEDEDANVRMGAANTLGRHSSGADIDSLILALKDGSWNVRSVAAGALDGQSSEVVINALLAALKDEHPWVRMAAAKTLRGQPLRGQSSEAVIDALILALKDENASVRSVSASALKELSSLSEAAIKRLIAMINDRDDRSALEILQQHSLFYSSIENLDINILELLSDFWLKSSVSNNISCYEFTGTFYVRVDGEKHKISSNPMWIATFREVLGKVMKTD